MRTPPTASDESLVCGRAAETEEIVLNCRSGRLTVVDSEPDLGVSTLLRAAAEPALRRDGFITVVYSDWQGRHIGAQLRQAVISAVKDQTGANINPEFDSLRDIIARVIRVTEKPVAILLDQFEEYLRCHWGTEVSDDFDAAIANVVTSRTTGLVIGIESQGIEILERLSQQIPNLLGHRVTLGPLTSDAARDAVSHYAARAKMEIESAAVAEIVASPAVASGEGVNPLMVRLAADRLFEAERRAGSSAARASTLRSHGGADHLVMRSLDPLMLELGMTQAALFSRWFPFLYAHGRRRVVSEKTLRGHSGNRTRTAIRLLPKLIQYGLMATYETSNGMRFTIARGATALILEDWRRRRESSLQTKQRALFGLAFVLIAAIVLIAGYVAYKMFSTK